MRIADCFIDQRLPELIKKVPRQLKLVFFRRPNSEHLAIVRADADVIVGIIPANKRRE